MERPTRQEQAQAILRLGGHRLASQILGRRATTAADFEEAFNLERIDLLSEIATPGVLLSLGRNIVGPRDGLYVLDDEHSYRVYIQERGVTVRGIAGASFDDAREAAIDYLLQLGGLPYRPAG